MVGAHVTGEDLEASGSAGKLRFYPKQGTGVDKIDVETAKKLHVPVMNTLVSTRKLWRSSPSA